MLATERLGLESTLFLAAILVSRDTGPVVLAQHGASGGGAPAARRGRAGRAEGGPGRRWRGGATGAAPGGRRARPAGGGARGASHRTTRTTGGERSQLPAEEQRTRRRH
jgi:hypothetical protein